MKKIFLCCLIFALILCTSCAPKYTTDISMQDLAESVIVSLDPNVSFVRAEAEYLNGYFSMPGSVFNHRIYYAADGNNLDEFGIFYTTQPELLEDHLEDYLDECLEENQSFYDSYIPEQTPKLRDAEVRVFGNCVAYGILSKEDQKAFFDTIDETLRV